MRESIGITSIFQIVILFIFVFVAIMCFTFNHSKAFAVKDEIISILENDGLASYKANQGVISTTTASNIAGTIRDLGYRNTGTCSTGYTGYDANGSVISSGEGASFCIKAVNVVDSYITDANTKCGSACKVATQSYPTMVYYEVELFYSLDIPILTTFLNLTVHGSTKVMYLIG